MVHVERTAPGFDWTTDRRRPRWFPSRAGVAPALAVIVWLGTLYSAWTVTGSSARATAIMMIGLAGASVFAAFVSRWAQAALADRLDIMNQALDAAPDAHLIVAADGSAAYANLAFNHLFPGRGDPLDRVERSVAADSGSVTEFRRLRGRAAAGIRAIGGVSLRDAGDGTVARLNISTSPITGRPGYTIWKICDITAYYKAETIIPNEENELVDFFDSAPIGFYSADSSGRLCFVNQTLAQWLGSTPSELLASGARLRDCLASVPAGEAPPFDPFGGAGDGTGRGEVLLKTRQGRIVPAWIGQSVVGSGAELRTRSIVCDLTPEREGKAALRLAHRFQRFFANAPVGSALLDHSGRFEEANHALGELFGVAPQDLVGRELIGLLNEEDRDGITSKLAAAANGRMERDPIEIRITCPRERTIVLFLSRIDDGAEGEPPVTGLKPGAGLSLHFIDITEQKNLEIQFAQSQKMQAVGQLAGGVAHDFNNLLTAMIGFCDLLLLRFQPGDPSFADIMQIQQNANRAANLVRQLLAFSRQQTLQPRVLSVTDVLVDLSHLLRRLIGENIELKVVHGRDLGLAKVDQGQFEQVIINLAVNARDAMPVGGTLTIRTANVCQEQALRRRHEIMPAGDYILIKVTDTGVGIPGDNLARIFDPFFSTKEVGSGTGLGLSTVYGIVKQTGGFVFVDSHPGQGATFEIYLPRYQAADPAVGVCADAAEPPPDKDLTGCGTVLLVEDEGPVRKFGVRALRNKGYKVIEAESGEAALDVIRNVEERIDLLITDVVMPRLDGPRLVREVREMRPDIKVIFISGYAEDAFRQRLDRDSDIDFLPKPFSLKQLASKVKEVIGGGAA